MKKILTIVVLLFVVTITHAQFSGSYNVGTGETYTSLKSFCDALNAGTVTGNITVYITTDLTEIDNSALGVNTDGFSITIKPSEDVDKTITFSKAADNGASSGGLLIGVKTTSSWNDRVVTKNITIDGYADGGSTRRLTLKTSSTAHTAHTPIHVIGDVDNLTIKNCNLTAEQTTGSSAFGLISFRFATWASVDALPDNVVIDNCVLTSTTPSGAGIYLSNATSGTSVATPVGRPTGLEFKNNIISVKHRAISLNYAGTSSTHDNQISVNNSNTLGAASWGIGGANTGLVTTNVYNNRMIQLATVTTTGGVNGIRGIQASGGGTWNIYNNFITGFATPATGTAEILGIRAGSTSNIYHNTIVINNVTTTGSATQPTSGIVNFAATCDVRNNIIITEEDDFVNYCIYGAPAPTTSNYNNFYRTGTINAKIGFATSARATLEDWQTATSKDANSKSVAITFTSATDLHLSGPSNGDVNLIGVTGLGIATDIDGDARSGTYPYMGADEASTPLPVELVSFSAVAKGKNVELRWNTATETNNYGFDVEKSVNGVWSKVGFVQGAGNSNAPKEYGYVDAVTANGTYSYRLKQIDRDGKFNYIPAIEVNVNTIVKSYDLAQNFPNPFNPTTTIRFSVQQLEQASVKVFDITGREVVTLFNDIASPGQVYNVQFNATGLASGIYFYVLQTQNFREVKKMQLLK